MGRGLGYNLDVHQVNDMVAIVFKYRNSRVSRFHDVRDGVEIQNHVLVQHVNYRGGGV